MASDVDMMRKDPSAAWVMAKKTIGSAKLVSEWNSLKVVYRYEQVNLHEGSVGNIDATWGKMVNLYTDMAKPPQLRLKDMATPRRTERGMLSLMTNGTGYSAKNTSSIVE